MTVYNVPQTAEKVEAEGIGSLFHQWLPDTWWHDQDSFHLTVEWLGTVLTRIATGAREV